MPRVKRAEQPFAAVGRLLIGYGITAKKLSEILGCCYNTAARRLKNPSELTLGDLERVVRKGGVPIMEIRESIKL